MNYSGHRECDEVCDWLSEILGQPAIMIRASKDRESKANLDHLPWAKETDVRGQFLTEATCHLVNTKSIDSLIKDVNQKYDSKT